MRLTVEIELRYDDDEPNLIAAAALEKLAERLRDEAPHDFVTSGFTAGDYAVRSAWKAR